MKITIIAVAVVTTGFAAAVATQFVPDNFREVAAARIESDLNAAATNLARNLDFRGADAQVAPTRPAPIDSRDNTASVRPAPIGSQVAVSAGGPITDTTSAPRAPAAGPATGTIAAPVTAPATGPLVTGPTTGSVAPRTAKPVKLAQAEVKPADQPAADPAKPVAEPPAAAKAGKALLEGSFKGVDKFHTGSGIASIVKDGDHAQVKLSNFSSTAGPDLEVWLVSVEPKRDGDVTKAKYLSLGKLKSTSGDQVYSIPAGTDLTQYKSVVIWCKAFSVLFSSAGLKPVS
jgi:hypothetical protein